MDSIVIGVIGIGILFLLLAMSTPIYIGMGVIGFVGFGYLNNFGAALSILGSSPFTTSASYTMSAIPLFVLMGSLIFESGLGESIYRATNKWIGHLPGGLAIATVFGCALFSAVSGSSVATAATMGKVSLKEMKRYKYDPGMATGCVAAGGTLGILIPPSMGFIVYGTLTEQSIGKLFIAGIFPGVILTFIMSFAIYVICHKDPSKGPKAPKTAFLEKLVSLRGIWPILLLFAMVMGGIYFGVVTPNEAAGVGAALAFLLGLIKRKLRLKNLGSSLVETVHITAMILAIIIAASIFNYFIALTQIPSELTRLIVTSSVPKYGVLVLLLMVYLVLGCLMETFSVMILTLPIFFPLIVSLGFDPIWFGVVMVLGNEMALITPPIGINVFVISGVAEDVPMVTIFRGIMPFVLCIICVLILLTIFPQIALFLPSFM